MEENKGILLESGTNEFEMLSFKVGDGVFGVNVSKVKEVVRYQPITMIPGSDTRILGMIMPRDEIITVIDLKQCLFKEASEKNDDNYFIICHFNSMTIAFQVDSVIDIRRYNWKDIVSVDSVLNSEDNMVTGLIKTKNAIISIVDFEKIMVDINVNNGLTINDVNNIKQEIIMNNRNHELKVLVAEDSKVLNKLITDSLSKVGFEYATFYDGESAYNALVENIKQDNIKHFDAIISDIEMPAMDGMRFCKLCKENVDYKNIPFIIFSSLIDSQMQKKCESVGADYCLSKPQIGSVIEVIQKLVFSR